MDDWLRIPEGHRTRHSWRPCLLIGMLLLALIYSQATPPTLADGQAGAVAER